MKTPETPYRLIETEPRSSSQGAKPHQLAHFPTGSSRLRSRLALPLALGLLPALQADEIFIDYNSFDWNPIGTKQGGNGIGWWPENGNPEGLYYLTLPRSDNFKTFVLPNFSDGQANSDSFSFECDIIVGNGTTATPGNGFSFSFARAGDPAVQNPSDSNNFQDGKPYLGTRTGIVVAFVNNLSDAARVDQSFGSLTFELGSSLPSGVVGNSSSGGLAHNHNPGAVLFLDGNVLDVHEMPLRNGDCTDPLSIQTGPDGPNSASPFDAANFQPLCWTTFKLENDGGDLAVWWKGAIILGAAVEEINLGQGHCVVAGENGHGGDQTVAIDNLKLKFTTSSDSTPPTAPSGMTVTREGETIRVRWNPGSDGPGKPVSTHLQITEKGDPNDRGDIYLDWGDPNSPLRTFDPFPWIPCDSVAIPTLESLGRSLDGYLWGSTLDSAGNESTWLGPVNLGATLGASNPADYVFTPGIAPVGTYYRNLVPGSFPSDRIWDYPDQSGRVTGVHSDIANPGRGILNNYSQRTSFSYQPGTTGEYRFWLSADDSAAMYQNDVKVVGTSSWSNEYKVENASQPGALSQGTAYLHELVFDQEGGDSWWKMNVTGPGSLNTPPNPSSYLSGFNFGGHVPTEVSKANWTWFGTTPSDLTVANGKTAYFDSTVFSTAVKSPKRGGCDEESKAPAPVAFQWYRNGQEIPGAVQGSYSFDVSSGDDQSIYILTASGLGGVVESKPFTIHVSSDPSGEAWATHRAETDKIEIWYKASNVPSSYSLDLLSSTLNGKPLADVIVGSYADERKLAVEGTAYSTPASVSARYYRLHPSLLGEGRRASGGARRLAAPDDPIELTIPIQTAFPPRWAAIGGVTGNQEAEAIPGDRPGDFDLISGGNGMWGNTDQATFVYEEVTGDFDKKVRVEHQDPSSQWPRTGISFRAALDPDSAHALITKTGITTAEGDAGGNDNQMYGRVTQGGPTIQPYFLRGPGREWMRLMRRGDKFHGFTGPDGIHWVYVGHIHIPDAPQTGYVGMIYCPENGNIAEANRGNFRAKLRNYGDTYAAILAQPDMLAGTRRSSSIKIHTSKLLANDTHPGGGALGVVAAGSPLPAGSEVTLDREWVVFHPPPGFTGSEASFRYTITDGREAGSTSTATLQFAADNGGESQNRAGIDLLSGGCLRVRFDGIPGRTYTIQTATDLVSGDWTAVGTAQAGATGVYAIEHCPGSASQRFYRSVFP